LTSEHFDVVVVGGGQAGLAVGFHLARRNLNFVILDTNPRGGEAWRMRWESLRLFTPARLDGLPGTPFPDRAGALPTKDEMANYLESYAGHHKLPIRPGIRVEALSRDGNGYFLTAGNRRFEANQVVVATGGHPNPRRPDFAAELDQSLDAVQQHRVWLAGRATGTVSPVLYSRPSWWLATKLITTKTSMGRKMATQLRTKRDATCAHPGK
jgi:putative flavoprotein involved in K+ transport